MLLPLMNTGGSYYVNDYNKPVTKWIFDVDFYGRETKRLNPEAKRLVYGDPNGRSIKGE